MNWEDRPDIRSRRCLWDSWQQELKLELKLGLGQVRCKQKGQGQQGKRRWWLSSYLFYCWDINARMNDLEGFLKKRKSFLKPRNLLTLTTT